MNDALITQWREHAARAFGWDAGEDPEPVLEALALSVALELTGDLGRAPRSERDRLRQIGQRALLFVGGQPAADEDELEARRMCAAIARDGLRALSSRPSEDAAAETRATIPAGDLSRMLGGRLDAFASGSLAMRVRRSKAAMAELALLIRLADPTERTIALAAAEGTSVLDPAGGRIVGRLEALGVEAFLFDGAPRRIAIYAEEPDALRLVAPELTTEDLREGYWVGRVADGARRIEATLHAGDKSADWVLEIDA
jgi:hypothetical protein